MTATPPKRRKYETRRRNFESRIDPKHLQVDRSEWIQPVRVPAPITLPVTSITTSMVSDADLGLISDVWDQRAAERLLLDACARRRAA
ncbi:hypothetical protein [Methylobacterium oryzae]|uniref:hypothetical protein n=1 Tax=Methylobacterium oryzae TaxID=334852 RepID=UPI0005C214C6|nr:hypothetical protein [Methylobacterium oryzae]